MKPVIAAFDDFFKDPVAVRRSILGGEFSDITNPIDAVVYPNINKEIPSKIREVILTRLEEILGGKISAPILFARATLENAPAAPHWVHSDKIMGQYSAHIYLSEHWPAGAGTSFWSHKTEGVRHTSETNTDVIASDARNLEAWDHLHTIQGRFNRLLIHDASYWHCAEPIGGWGESLDDSRLVITCFFNLIEE